ncbi:MAG: hypothetical protein ACTSRS_14935 [Candidatus Helarchaeota archaeon]
MNLINTKTKGIILDILLRQRKSLGIYTIAKIGNISISEVWRQIPLLCDYGLLIEENKGSSGKRKKYKINFNNQIIKTITKLYEQSKVVNQFINLKPLDACKQILKKYYITGAYAIKEQSWDICYPDGCMLAVDPSEYEKAELLKNCFINRWNFILLKKPIQNCDFFYDEFEGINKASREQAVADGIANYKQDPNNVEILYFLLIEDLDWGRLLTILDHQGDELARFRIHYLFVVARLLGGQLYPADLFRPKSQDQIQDPHFIQDAMQACFRILLCNGIAQEQAW